MLCKCGRGIGDDFFETQYLVLLHVESGSKIDVLKLIRDHLRNEGFDHSLQLVKDLIDAPPSGIYGSSGETGIRLKHKLENYGAKLKWEPINNYSNEIKITV